MKTHSSSLAGGLYHFEMLSSPGGNTPCFTATTFGFDSAFVAPSLAGVPALTSSSLPPEALFLCVAGLALDILVPILDTAYSLRNVERRWQSSQHALNLPFSASGGASQPSLR